MANHSMEKNKIVLLPFPFDDFKQIKVRPAICLTNVIGKHAHIVVAFISSKMPDEKLKSDVMIAKVQSSFKQTGLSVDSVIRLHKLVTIPKQIIKRELGSADVKLANEIRKKLNDLFD